MSRIGKQPIPVPAGVEVKVSGRTVSVSKGDASLQIEHHPAVAVAFDDGAREVQVTRENDARQSRALHGLTRSLVNNMVQGVQKPFEKKLEIHGVGYNAVVDGTVIKIVVGFANTVEKKIPAGVTVTVDAKVTPTVILVQSADKQKVGQFAAEIRAVRPPEPYKGKGIRYADEHVRRKAGKAEAGKG